MNSNDMVKYAGVTTINGATKMRFANSIERVKALIKEQHQIHCMEELPRSMEKLEACSWLLENLKEPTAVALMTIEEAHEKYLTWSKRKESKSSQTPKVKATRTTSAPQPQTAEERLAELRTRAVTEPVTESETESK